MRPIYMVRTAIIFTKSLVLFGLVLGLFCLGCSRPAATSAVNANDPATVVIEAISGLQTGFVAHWRFQGTVGRQLSEGQTIDDSSGNSHKAYVIGGPTYSSVDANGIVGLSFNGSNDRIFVPDHPSFALSRGMTLEAQVVVEQAPSSTMRNIVFRGDNRAGLDPWYLSIQNGKVLFALTDDKNDFSVVSAPEPLPTYQLMHIAATWDRQSGQQRLFIDKKEVASTKTTIQPMSDLQIGGGGIGIANRTDSSDQAFRGKIVELRIADRALEPSEFLAAPQPSPNQLVSSPGPTTKVPVNSQPQPTSPQPFQDLLPSSPVVSNVPANNEPFSDWLQDFERAKQVAMTEHKDILIAFDGSDWCGWSVRMAEEIFLDSNFNRLIGSRFVLVFVDFPRGAAALRRVQDADRNEKLKEFFEVEGFPTLILTDAQGRPYGRDGYTEGGIHGFLKRINQWQSVRQKRDQLLSAVNNATGRQQLEAMSDAIELLDDLDMLHYYSDSLRTFTSIAIAQDPKNEYGVYEQVFLMRWFAELKKIDEDDAEKMRWLVGALDNWTATCTFRDPDRGALVNLVAGRCMLAAGDSSASERYFKAGLACKPTQEFLRDALQEHLSRGRTLGLSGTGFIVSNEGHILTNYHVIEDLEMVSVRFEPDGPLYPARIVAKDEEGDMALLQIQLPAEKKKAVLRVTKQEARRGVEVAAFGFPMGDAVQLTRGIVSAQTSDGMLLLDLLVNPGNSGGPLCDRQGNIVGMVRAKTLSSVTVDSYGYAIPASTIQEFLEVNIRGQYTLAPAGNRDLSWEQVDQRVAPGVVMVFSAQ